MTPPHLRMSFRGMLGLTDILPAINAPKLGEPSTTAQSGAMKMDTENNQPDTVEQPVQQQEPVAQTDAPVATQEPAAPVEQTEENKPEAGNASA